MQELYFTLVDEEEEKSFEACVRVLDEHFVPKANLPFERHQFRQMSQLNSEKVDQFVSRLRQKATTCEFANLDEAIRDQLIEKCFEAKVPGTNECDSERSTGCRKSIRGCGTADESDA